MTGRALEGVRVLDLSEYVSGAYCGKLLAAYGAEVIKIESPRGDVARREGPFKDGVPHSETSAMFAYLNTSKLGVTLDISTVRGKRILRDLVSQSDVLIENYGSVFWEGMGLTPADFHQWNSRIVSVSMSYFGRSGPYARFRGTPLVAFAMGGYMYLTGEPDREPLQGAGPQPEYLAGLHGTIAALSGLHHREATGVGVHAEVPIFEMMVSLHQFTTVRYNYGGIIQNRLGNKYAWGHPISIYRVRDGHIAVSAASEEQAQRLLYMMDKGDLLEDPRFANGTQRLLNAEAFDALVEPWLKERGKQEIFFMAQEWRVPCAPVTTVEDLLQDPQYAARGFWQKIEHPLAGRLTMPGAPFRMSETPWEPGRPPLLGEHNRLIYGDRLGYASDDLTRLRQDGVV